MFLEFNYTPPVCDANISSPIIPSTINNTVNTVPQKNDDYKNKITFSEEQQQIFDKYELGDNIFITGPGGSGKTEIIRHIYRHAKKNNKRIEVCALTGRAAILLNCNAKTIHSWAGIGIASGSEKSVISSTMSKKRIRSKWIDIDILVVDEVSMMSVKLINILNALGKSIRKNDKPFGGIQIIFSGDFYQLPPVGNNIDNATSQYCFESEDWNTIFNQQNIIQLVKIYRQNNSEYINILNQIRTGKITRKTFDILNKKVLDYSTDKKCDDNDTFYTKIFPVKHKVSSLNKIEFSKLDELVHNFASTRICGNINHNNDSDDVSFISKIHYTAKEKDIEWSYIENNLLCEQNISLKIGSKVMCVANITNILTGKRISNGSQGIIIKFEYYNSSDINIKSSLYPLVNFIGIGNILMIPYIWKSEKIKDIGIQQIPLILAWAITIHKAQGSTVSHAEIDVGQDVFEYGQTYVALSRVKSLDGLRLRSFNVANIKINKRVKQFYKMINDK
jgi:ATP-dependent DNA helicase PIF1